MANFIVSAEHAVNVLNEAFKLDPKMIELSLTTGSRTNQDMVNHPTIQVQDTGIVGLDGETIFKLSFIGLLNGIFGVDENGQGPIARKYDEQGNFAGFCINTNLKADARPVEQPVWDGSIDYDCGR